MAQFLWVCLGGAVGTGLRYLTCRWALHTFGPAFPYGTLAVNVLGSFLLGVLMAAGLETTRLSATTHLALTTGLLGGFTTYSTFSQETLQHLLRGAYALGALNMALTVFGCLAASLIGWLSGRWLVAG